jgi:cytochrome c-type biogenesis protein CcmH/NrfF
LLGNLRIPMRILWFIPITALILGAGALLRARRRGGSAPSLSTDPVSGQWLAEARTREEHPW